MSAATTPPDSGLSATSAPARRLRRLVTKRAARDEERAYVVEGTRSIAEAIEHAEVEGLYVEVGAVGGEAAAAAIVDAAQRRGVPVEWLRDGVVRQVADSVTPQPILAVVRRPDTALRAPAAGECVVVLGEVREPGNAGTLVRSAEAAGAVAVVFCEGSVDPFAPKTVRASAGALFYVPVVQGGNLREVLDVLGQTRTRRLGTMASGGTPVHAVDWTPPTALVLGNEAWGVPEAAHDAIDEWVTIPMSGRADSLNVAMAGTVMLFERLHRLSEVAPT